VKFNRFLVRALRQGADLIATGHYARVVAAGGGRHELHAGVDSAKDQSYFLWGVGREALSRVLLPIGDYTKSEVRAIARRAGLPVADKKESTDICFVPQGDYGAFLEKERSAAVGGPASEESTKTAGSRISDESWEAALAPGPIVNAAGATVGTHAGFARVTIGQRKGLGIASGRRLYVTGIDPAERRVVVGEDAELFAPGCEAEGASFLADVPSDAPARVSARIRHRHAPVPSTLLRAASGRVRILFDEPQRAVTPGQSVVFYDGARVVGGAIISGAIARPA
jgi:tRNA-specific 2-thiouridylase